MEEGIKKQNIDKWLLVLIKKYEKGELNHSQGKGLRNYMHNLSIRYKMDQLNSGMEYLIKSSFDKKDIDCIDAHDIKNKLIERYHEARQIPDILIDDTMNKMENIFRSNGRYQRLTDIGEIYKSSQQKAFSEERY